VGSGRLPETGRLPCRNLETVEKGAIPFRRRAIAGEEQEFVVRRLERALTIRRTVADGYPVSRIGVPVFGASLRDQARSPAIRRRRIDQPGATQRSARTTLGDERR